MTINCIDVPYEQSTTISITPTLFYSYQCTSALLTNYIPVLLVMFVISAVAIPLLQLILITLPKEVVEKRLPLLNHLRKQSPPSFEKLVADVLLDLLVLMTFGMAAPLLGLMIVVKQIISAMQSRIMIGCYTQQAEDPSAALALLDDVAQQFRGGDTKPLLGYLLCVLGIFWGAMIFDMVADLHGNTAGGIAWAVAFAVWVTVASLCYWSNLGDRVTVSVSQLIRRMVGARKDMVTHPVEVNRSSLGIARIQNPLNSVKVNAAGDDRVVIQTLTSEFGLGPDTDLEMTEVTASNSKYL